MVSSHDVVRQALVNEGIEYTLVFPERYLKAEYVERFKQRGSPESFVNLLSKNWDAWITELEEQPGCTKLKLEQGQYLSDIPSAARVSTAGPLTSKTSTAGVADAADVTFSLVSGDQSEAIVIYVDTGNESTSSLVAYIHQATGLPVTPSGGDIQIVWDNGANKIFKL